jgi:F-type H+-transporting ATPase subunit b
MLRRLITTAVVLLALVGSSCAVLAAGGVPSAAPSGSAGADVNPINVSGVNFRGDLTIWTAVVFLVVLAILWRFAWGPIAQGMAKREQEIAAHIAEAQRNHEEAKQLLADYEKKLADSKQEVRGILEEGRRHAEQIGRQMLDKAKEDAVAERQRALEQIEAATAGALKELAQRSATLAVELAGKIVHARLNPQDHARLVEEAVAKFAGGNGKK